MQSHGFVGRLRRQTGGRHERCLTRDLSRLRHRQPRPAGSLEDGFPTDRIELTACCEPGRAGLHPGDNQHRQFTRYFGTLLTGPEEKEFPSNSRSDWTMARPRSRSIRAVRWKRYARPRSSHMPGRPKSCSTISPIRVGSTRRRKGRSPGSAIFGWKITATHTASTARCSRKTCPEERVGTPQNAKRLPSRKHNLAPSAQH